MPILIVLVLLLSGCTTLARTSSIVANDVQAFEENAAKYGSETDVACAKLLNAYFQAVDEIINDDSGALLAFTYRGVVTHRLTLAMEKLLAENCGALIVEITAAAARFRR
jgi:hypothetical protein